MSSRTDGYPGLRSTGAAVLGVWTLACAPPVDAQSRCLPSADGGNTCPVQLTRPPEHPLSAMAEIGRQLFFDTGLSGSGRLSCASCHDPAAHYAPAGNAAFALGGRALHDLGKRAVPSLTYLDTKPPFSIGPDNAVSEETPPPPPPGSTTRANKNAADPAAGAANIVPQGGLFWDGRADTLQAQAAGPLYDPHEMASDRKTVIARLRHAPYTAQLMTLAGPNALREPDLLIAEALFALARYQIENPAFHLYNSKFDAWLEGRGKLTQQERSGYLLFNDPQKGNCAACHVDQPGPDRMPPLFTDHQFEALGVPRNPAYPASWADLGLCTSGRTDLGDTPSAWCGMFATPTLRNSAARHHFFHNGVYSTLRQVVDFYILREAQPEKIYPADREGGIPHYNDLPTRYHGGVDVADAPFNQKRGDTPVLTERERDDIVAFLQTLTDGPYTPAKR